MGTSVGLPTGFSIVPSMQSFVNCFTSPTFISDRHCDRLSDSNCDSTSDLVGCSGLKECRGQDCGKDDDDVSDVSDADTIEDDDGRIDVGSLAQEDLPSALPSAQILEECFLA